MSSTKRSYSLSGFSSSSSAPSPTASSSNSNDSAIDSCSSGGSPPPEEGCVSASSSSRKRKHLDKESDQYKKRRERNNQAVRKSRAKSKQKRMQTDYQLRQLMDKNKELTTLLNAKNEEVKTLQKELYFIRSWAGHPAPPPSVSPPIKEEKPLMTTFDAK